MKHYFTFLLIVCGLLWSSGCSSILFSPPTPTPTPTPTPLPAATTISGFVFRDLDADGVREPREPGEPNITVAAYDADDKLVAAATTDVNGDYVLNADLDNSIIKGVEYVVIFSGWPPHLTPGPHGQDSGTEMQFVSGGATDINFGVHNPDQYVAPKQLDPSDTND